MDQQCSNGKDSFWIVEDSRGVTYGIYDRVTAAELSDRIFEADPTLEWVVINQNTGMIGMPTQTLEGIIVALPAKSEHQAREPHLARQQHDPARAIQPTVHGSQRPHPEPEPNRVVQGSGCAARWRHKGTGMVHGHHLLGDRRHAASHRTGAHLCGGGIVMGEAGGDAESRTSNFTFPPAAEVFDRIVADCTEREWKIGPTPRNAKPAIADICREETDAEV
ncbi:hypothetical protein [Paraburkholderia phosphatilytica]|uniref:hypothetical protein n=1 Tax=Paraburkholderia phosphatilytica TaxID=2282883 RepID=UPI000E4AFDB4|nr:hypothetical protein [Paraburkholderia phosphatilytica]